MASRVRLAILALIAAAAMIGIFCLGRIPQDPAYHHFADSRKLGAIPNVWNVLSNLSFLAVGLYGFRRRRLLRQPQAGGAYTALCFGALFIALGSAYYHYAPSITSLFADRVAMTVSFMALFTLVLEERVIPGAGGRLLWPLLALGVGAASHWYWSEGQGAGDLRAYVLVQYLPLLLVPASLWLFRGDYLNSHLLWSALACYFLAKAGEHFDQQVFAVTGMFSGHTLKHLLAGLALLCVIRAVPAGSSGR